MRLCNYVCGILAAILCLGPAMCAAQGSGAPASPAIDKIDPPNWWVKLPDPMLLLRGRGLSNARISVHGKGVRVVRVQTSGNGHWAFVWLKTAGAGAQTLHVEAQSPQGHAEVDFALNERKPASEGFQGFSSKDVMYLIMTDRFADGDPSNNEPAEGEGRSAPRGWHGGDFRGIEQHLDYLQQLGITTVWTTPAYDNSGERQSYHGYGATDMYAVDPHFGTLADYQHLAAALHARGMKIVLDTVPNHVGPAHVWAKDPPAPNWFHGTPEYHIEADGDFISLPDPHSLPATRRAVTEGWFANVLPDLNQENPLVEQYLIQNAVWWVESAGLDGLRLDTFPYVGRAFWHDFHEELHRLYPRLTTVGEAFNSDPTITSFFAGGVKQTGPDGASIDTGLDTPFDFPVYFTLRKVLLQNAPMTELRDALRQDRLYPHPERLVTFLGNHDTARFLSQPGATPARLRMAFALLATLRGMPQIYSGDEIAMSGGEDPENRHDFPGGFASGEQSAFVKSQRTVEQQRMYETVRALLHMRAEHAALQTGQQQNLMADATGMVFVRAMDTNHGCSTGVTGDRLVVAVNRDPAPRTFHLQTTDTSLDGCAGFVAAGEGSAHAALAGMLDITVEAEHVAVFTVQ